VSWTVAGMCVDFCMLKTMGIWEQSMWSGVAGNVLVLMWK